MRRLSYWLPLFLLGMFLLTGCEDDEPVANQPPETKIFLDSIQLSGEDRLRSVVTLFWSGEDVDGFIEGYELSLDKTNWDFVTVTDSTFRFTVDANSDTADVDFFVRAIDNKGNADPTPAHLVIPIQNTQPSIQFKASQAPKDTVLTVLTHGWTANDLDGKGTIDRIEFRLNAGNWTALPAEAEIISLVPANPDQAGSGPAEVFVGLNSTPLGSQADDFRVGDTNRIFVRVVDQGGLISEVDTSAGIFVRRKASEVLAIGNLADAADVSAHLTPIEDAAAFGSVDFLNFADPARRPSLFNTTLSLLFQGYDEILWWGDKGSLNDIESAEGLLQTHLNNGGKLFSSFLLPPDQSFNSPLLSLTPVERLDTNHVNGIMTADTGRLRAVDPAFPSIKNQGGFITGVNPFIPQASASVIYEADIVTSSFTTWNGPRTIGVLAMNASQQVNQVFVGFPLHKLENPTKLREFYIQLAQRFDW